MSDDVRLPDAIGLILERAGELERAAAELVVSARDMVREADLSDAEIAEIYWRFERVPAIAMGKQLDVLEIARAHPWWSWVCPGCGIERFVTSRTDKKRIERPPRHCAEPLCEECVKARIEHHRVEWDAQREARLCRERELRTMPYRQYLQTEEWQERRKMMLRRAGYACQVCNRRRVLHVHHRTYERRGAELTRDLIVLCDDCHALYHGKGLLAPHGEDAQ